MLLEVISSFISGFFHRLGQQTGNSLTDIKQKGSKNTTTEPASDSDLTDLEVWNIVTSYGKYKEVWPIYRTSGLLEAIKVRDEKTDFDLKMSEIRNLEQLPVSPTQQSPSSKPVQKTIHPTVRKIPAKLNRLDIDFAQVLSSYCEE